MSPIKKYLLQQQVEKKEKSARPGPVPAAECRWLFYGASYLLEQISEKTSISDDLKSCFGGAAGEILSIAYDLVIEEGQPMCRFPRWGRTHWISLQWEIIFTEDFRNHQRNC